VFFGQDGGFVAFLIYLLAIWMKLNQEEALLTRHSPEAYPEYKSRTRALIPFVW
jgi:protein-S-isoprenylcysteine O-methyltransferase Ste14